MYCLRLYTSGLCSADLISVKSTGLNPGKLLTGDLGFLAGLRAGLSVGDGHFNLPQRCHNLLRLVASHGHDQSSLQVNSLSLHLVQKIRGRAQARVAQLRLGSLEGFTEIAEQSCVRVPEAAHASVHDRQWLLTSECGLKNRKRICDPQFTH
jgi:hypothetical protein